LPPRRAQRHEDARATRRPTARRVSRRGASVTLLEKRRDLVVDLVRIPFVVDPDPTTEEAELALSLRLFLLHEPGGMHDGPGDDDFVARGNPFEQPGKVRLRFVDVDLDARHRT